MYVKKYLDDKYGEDYLKEKGLRVYTTIDKNIQETVAQFFSQLTDENFLVENHLRAEKLLDKFKSLSLIFNASEEELNEILKIKTKEFKNILNF